MMILTQVVKWEVVTLGKQHKTSVASFGISQALLSDLIKDVDHACVSSF